MVDANAIQQQNAFARQVITGGSPVVIQKIASVTQAAYPYTAGQASTINIPVVNVGLIRRFFVRIQMNVAQSAAETHTQQTFGPACILSNITFTDMNNLIRVNTTGWHLALLNSARRQFAYGAAITSDSPLGFGSNYPLIKGVSGSLSTAQNMYMVYEIPLAYADNDLRGAMFANVVNATSTLSLTINPNLFAASTADAVQSVFKSSSATLGKVNTFTIDVYQEYYDQLPRNQDGSFLLPMVDLATQYNIMNTTNTGLAVGADQSIAYANFRTYLSTLVIFDNGGTLNAGTDVNYFSLATANSMNLFKLDPFMVQMLNSRLKLNDDMAAGTYYFDHRQRPLTTNAYGNMQLNVNPSTVNANAQLLIGFEFMSLQNQLANAGSISSS